MKEVTTLSDHPIRALLELVQQHKLDPWDVDIEKLTHLYLERIGGPEEPDLRASGRALLSASVLLRIKSAYALNGNGRIQAPEESFDESFDLDFPDLGEITLVQNTPRKITLVDLLGALQEALEEIPVKKIPQSKKMEKIVRFLNEYDVNIEKHIDELYNRILSLATSGEKITLARLAEEPTKLSIARTFLLLLFLYANKKIVLKQEELFGDIVVSLPEQEEEHGNKAGSIDD
ncbi:MAG: segregation/condensation protein A [Hadesarchaea archaeon]|nr:MAG: segregation/condensation protein A [Hadesarchaea archaeon]